MGKFTIELTGFAGIGGSLKDLNLQQILEQEMLNVRARLIADTQAGKTADGGSLKAYSRRYIEEIDSGYIPGKAPGSHTPNLTATGELMRSLQIESGENEVRLFFSGTHSKRQKVSDKHAAKKRKAAVKKHEGLVLQHRGNRSAAIKAALAPTAAQKAVRSQHAKAKRREAKFNAAFGRGSRRLSHADKHRGHSAPNVQNAVIAQGQYDRGRTGWLSFAQKDIDRIMKSVGDAVQKIFSLIAK